MIQNRLSRSAEVPLSPARNKISYQNTFIPAMTQLVTNETG